MSCVLHTVRETVWSTHLLPNNKEDNSPVYTMYIIYGHQLSDMRYFLPGGQRCIGSSKIPTSDSYIFLAMHF